MIWLTIIMGALSFLLQWLLAKKGKGETLSPAEQKRCNNLIARSRDVQAEMVAMGCKPEGEVSMDAEDTAVIQPLQRLAKRIEKARN
ncbi:MAG TPA: hypothetical protein VKI17_08625 [Gemmataceae bacterium]|nr:hypothetical protein [Gemmataceae bacterium]